MSDSLMKDQNDTNREFDGKFLSGVSGLDFTWNPELPSGNRVVSVMMWPKTLGGEKEILDEKDEKWYIIKVLKYMAKGKDGYDCLKLDKKAKPDEEVKGEPGDQRLGDEEFEGKYFTVIKEGLGKFLCPVEY